jgi:quercetin dioxygenase-like cupin family protein
MNNKHTETRTFAAAPAVRAGRTLLTKALTSGLIALSLAAGVAAQEGKVTTVRTQELVGMPGKEATMLTVDYPPGGSSTEHRHNAYVFVYVLEGSVIMQVRGGKEVILGPGQTFYESPEDVHTVSRNSSKIKPARFIVFFVKEKGAPLTVPIK